MTPYEHIQAYGMTSDLCTGRHLQSDAIQYAADLAEQLGAATSMDDVVWATALRIDIRANAAVSVLLSGKFGPPTAEMLQALRATARERAGCNFIRQGRAKFRR